MGTSTRYFDLVREMNNPYNHRLRLVESAKQRGIKSTARLFSTALGEQRQDPLVDKIDTSLRSVESLLGALLDVSKLDGGAVTAHPRAFAIDAVMATLAEEFSAIARERSCQRGCESRAEKQGVLVR